jgi:hypothetical protein
VDALTTTDADAITLSGLSYFCAAAAADVEMATALSWVEMAAVKQSGSSCFCAAVADTVETTMETAVAASKPQEPEASTPPVLILLRFFSLPLHLLLPFPFFLFPQAVFIYLIYTFTIIN